MSPYMWFLCSPCDTRTNEKKVSTWWSVVQVLPLCCWCPHSEQNPLSDQVWVCHIPCIPIIYHHYKHTADWGYMTNGDKHSADWGYMTNGDKHMDGEQWMINATVYMSSKHASSCWGINSHIISVEAKRSNCVCKSLVDKPCKPRYIPIQCLCYTRKAHSRNKLIQQMITVLPFHNRSPFYDTPHLHAHTYRKCQWFTWHHSDTKCSPGFIPFSISPYLK